MGREKPGRRPTASLFTPNTSNIIQDIDHVYIYTHAYPACAMTGRISTTARVDRQVNPVESVSEFSIYIYVRACAHPSVGLNDAVALWEVSICL